MLKPTDSKHLSFNFNTPTFLQGLNTPTFLQGLNTALLPPQGLDTAPPPSRHQHSPTSHPQGLNIRSPSPSSRPQHGPTASLKASTQPHTLPQGLNTVPPSPSALNTAPPLLKASTQHLPFPQCLKTAPPPPSRSQHSPSPPHSLDTALPLPQGLNTAPPLPHLQWVDFHGAVQLCHFLDQFPKDQLDVLHTRASASVGGHHACDGCVGSHQTVLVSGGLELQHHGMLHRSVGIRGGREDDGEGDREGGRMMGRGKG